MSDKLPDVHFGEIAEDQPADLPAIDETDDDEELADTPEDVMAILGFDPKDV